ncbi:lectin [Amycolatopsis jejuensis]|uniref:lectin n=1 Tax=Amycolatopsis jejuensis TaxID=330084 RepID=UPI0007C5CE02|nr:lectin [Amycolatopsis jejuensis]
MRVLARPRSAAVGCALALAVAGLSAVPAQAAPQAAQAVADPASLVNPFIGTTNDANDFPGADAPFGMVQWSPDTNSRPPGGGYNYKDSTITGFSLTHIAGPGCGAAGDLPVLPTTGGVNSSANVNFSHANESASAGYYQVKLDNGVNTELTATTRSGMGRFTFPAGNQSNLVFKVDKSQNATSNAQFSVVSNTQVRGQVTSGQFCGAGNKYTVYFDMVFDRPFSSSGSRSVTFDTSGNQVVQAKVGLSYVSSANAAANRAAENSGWDFNGTRAAVAKSWNDQLNKIKITGGSADQQKMFYTALYHSLLHPNVISDTNRQYPGFDGRTHTVDAGHDAAYGNYSGWDIYRSQAQLEAWVAPKVASDTAQSMVNDYQQTGIFPKWSENNGESYVMVGDPAAAIIADYYAFGARDFDTATALRGLVAQASQQNNDRPGVNYLNNPGYLPHDGQYGCCNFYGSAATTLEYATADFALSAFAGALGDTANQRTYQNRAQDWRNLLNPQSGFIQSRNADGSWVSNFDPTGDTGMVEGDSFIYTGMIPFNLAGLTQAKGGPTVMNHYLDTVLRSYKGENGYAWVGNEPSIELPWEYDYTGAPYRTQETVRSIQQQIWRNAPDGLADGNDDLGAMSAWYVWSALGMFPETPGTADLALGSPVFTQAVVTLPSGQALTINGNGAADNAPYVQSASWNGSDWNKAFAPPGAVSSGGTLTYNLGTAANRSWASDPSAAPPSYAGDTPGPARPRVGPVTSGVGASICLDDANSKTADGTPIQIYGCDSTYAQDWTVGTDSTLRVLGKCLDVDHSGTADGTHIQLWYCNNSGAQQWVADNGSLRNPNSGKCLDVPGGTTKESTQVQLYTCNNSPAQKWNLPS